jgi:hypothetical protein
VDDFVACLDSVLDACVVSGLDVGDDVVIDLTGICIGIYLING